MVQQFDRKAMKLQQLAQAWIHRYEVVQTKGDQSPEAQATFASFERFNSAVKDDPDLAWGEILKVVELTDNEFILENLAAGPLENLLVQHGDAFVARIEKQAINNKRFRWLLGGVWGERIPPLIWARIEQVLER